MKIFTEVIEKRELLAFILLISIRCDFVLLLQKSPPAGHLKECSSKIFYSVFSFFFLKLEPSFIYSLW